MITKASKTFKILLRINFKTIYFNFRCLPFRKAILLPFFISRKCKICSLKGKVEILGPISPGIIQIGYGHVGIFDKRYSRSVVEINGRMTFEGKCRIGHGSKLSVGKMGHLVFGHDFSISAESTIVCHKKIKFGHNVLLSWDVLIMDTDLHRIETRKIEHINPDKSIFIGDNVWVGCRSLILKGVNIPNGSIIAANSTIVKNDIDKENTILGGKPLRVLKDNVKWHL